MELLCAKDDGNELGLIVSAEDGGGGRRSTYDFDSQEDNTDDNTHGGFRILIVTSFGNVTLL